MQVSMLCDEDVYSCWSASCLIHLSGGYSHRSVLCPGDLVHLQNNKESQMKCVSLWHILHYTSGHVVMKAGRQNIGPTNDANFSLCPVSAVGCDVMQLSGGDADSAWASWHYAPETCCLSGCISTTKRAMSLCLAYFSFHVPFPPVDEVIHFRYEILRKSVPSFIIKT